MVLVNALEGRCEIGVVTVLIDAEYLATGWMTCAAERPAWHPALQSGGDGSCGAADMDVFTGGSENAIYAQRRSSTESSLRPMVRGPVAFGDVLGWSVALSSSTRRGDETSSTHGGGGVRPFQRRLFIFVV